MIEFRLGDLTADPPRLGRIDEQVANIQAPFELWADGSAIYEEPVFPVLELARELTRWRRIGLPAGEDFEFSSMSFEEDGAVWVRQEQEGWRVGSLFQDRPCMTIWSSAQLYAAIERLRADLMAAGHMKLGVDLTEALDRLK